MLLVVWMLMIYKHSSFQANSDQSVPNDNKLNINYKFLIFLGY